MKFKTCQKSENEKVNHNKYYETIKLSCEAEGKKYEMFILPDTVTLIQIIS